jgi:hypothetical protein
MRHIRNGGKYRHEHVDGVENDDFQNRSNENRGTLPHGRCSSAANGRSAKLVGHPWQGR